MFKPRRAKKNLDWTSEQTALLEGTAPGFGHTRLATMQKVQNLVDACCPYFCPFLPSLRRAYPELEWKHWTLDVAVDSWPNGEVSVVARKIRADIAKEADFVWFVSGTCDFVTARSQSGLLYTERLILFNATNGEIEFPLRRDFSVGCPRH